MRKIYTLIIALVASIGMTKAEVYSGTCGVDGDNLTWELNTEDSTLVITGSGAMTSWNLNMQYFAPWKSYSGSIRSVSLPMGLTNIGEFAFYSCYNLTDISFPNTITSIESCAFDGCQKLETINIPSSMTSINSFAFLRSGNLKTIVVENDNPVYDSRENCNAIIETATNKLVLGSINTIIPNSVTCIGRDAFRDSNIKDLSIPNNVTTIEDRAFWSCKIESISIPYSLTNIATRAFEGSSLKRVVINSKSIQNYKNTFGEQVREYVLEDSITEINQSAFKNSYQLESIALSTKITTIGNYAFQYCTKLDNFNIPDSVNVIAYGVFYGCSGLTSISVPDKVQSIASNAFYGCSKLQSLHLGKSILSLSQDAFISCGAIKRIDITTPTPPDSINVYQCGLSQLSIELLVPEENLEAYKNAPYWRNFKYINAIDGAEHTVIFYDWNGNELSRVQVPDGGSAVDLAPTPPAVEHQVFIGWSQDLSNVTQSMTVYAQYEPVKVLVQFVDWDGTVLKSDSVYYQGWVEAPDNPYRRGYYFTGWDRTFTWEDLVTDLVITAQYEALPEGSSFVREDGGIHALFSVSEGKQVLFSRGNLQFNAARGSHACADGTTQAGTWRFAPEQYDVKQWNNSSRGVEYDNWIDLFAYGATGYNGNLPTMDETTVSREMDGERSYYDFGLYNAISNGGNNPGEWRMFTQNEWRYLIQQRPHANKLHAHAKIPREYDYIYGVIILPDDGDTTLIYKEIDYNDPEAYLNYDPSVPTYTLAEWRQLEAKGALFFPAGGLGLVNNGYFNVNAIENGYYLVSFTPPSNYTNLLAIGFDTTTIWSGLNTNPECISVRLVKDAPISHLNAVANNSSYGSISGETIYFGEDITITATPNEGYHFVQWSDGITDNPRTFTLTGDSIITAEFAPNTYTLNVSCDEEQGTIEGESGSFDYLSEHVLTANAHYGYTFDKWSDGVTENPRTLLLTHDTTITAIFNINHYPIMFLNWNGERLSSQSVAYNHAAEAPQLPEREGYIFMGWTADIEHVIDTTFAIALYDKVGVEVTYKAEDGETIFSEHADLHIPNAPTLEGKTFAGWLTENIDKNGIVLRATYTVDNPTTNDDVTVVPGSNSANVTFPFVTGAITYVLVIRDLFGQVVCKIMFNASGRLLGIAFAPSRERSQTSAQTDNFQFTVEGLDPSTTYEYEFIAHDETDDVIETLIGAFTTTAEVPTDNEQVNSPSAARKYLDDGHLMIDANSHIFNTQGKMIK